MAKNIYKEFIKERIIDNPITREIKITQKEGNEEVTRVNKNNWVFDLEKIAQYPDRIITLRKDAWYF